MEPLNYMYFLLSDQFVFMILIFCISHIFYHYFWIYFFTHKLHRFANVFSFQLVLVFESCQLPDVYLNQHRACIWSGFCKHSGSNWFVFVFVFPGHVSWVVFERKVAPIEICLYLYLYFKGISLGWFLQAKWLQLICVCICICISRACVWGGFCKQGGSNWFVFVLVFVFPGHVSVVVFASKVAPIDCTRGRQTSQPLSNETRTNNRARCKQSRTREITKIGK